MTTEQNHDELNAALGSERLNANIARMEQLSARLTAALSNSKMHDPALAAPSSEIYMKAAAAYMAAVMQDPGKMIEQQAGFWGKTLKHYMDAQHQFLKGEFRAPSDPGPKDRRFSNPLWESHPWFNYIKQQYQLNAAAITAAVEDMTVLSAEDRKRVEYFTRQIVDLMAPTNFLGTNPDALQRAVESEGESLVQGLENLIRDIEANEGDLLITLADQSAFSVGGNIATTPGAVVYRNRMFELLQYRPTTETVHKTPLVIFPPWINKYYILDLKPQNSLIRWIVDQGYTVFVVSWVNPDGSYADVGLDDYIRDGYMRAIAETRRITGEAQVNTIGYCIGGTTLALTLAYLKRAGDTSVGSATFFTTMTDFSDPGEVGVFLDNDFVDGIERQSQQDGVLSKVFMSRTFSFLRSNDLIYAPAIRSYMMGEPPPAFDLLYWNGDATNLPARMAIDYLRGLYQDDGFARGEFKVLGHAVSLRDVTLPLFAIACETDHIAHWRGSFTGVQQMGSDDKTFILAESGHIAGIVNPPSKGKYGHYISDAPLTDISPDAWRQTSQRQDGSWWPRWNEWQKTRSGPQIAARVLGESGSRILAPAPGTYVHPEGLRLAAE